MHENHQQTALWRFSIFVSFPLKAFSRVHFSPCIHLVLCKHPTNSPQNHCVCVCVCNGCVCNGCFDVRLADTAAYLKHVISTYLQYIIFILFCFFLVVQDIHSKLIFLVTVYLHQTCSLTANGYSCVIPPGRGGGGLWKQNAFNLL